MSEESKKAALERFIELDRRGLIEHDWTDKHKTGLVKLRLKLDLVPPISNSKH
jgi:hypothetical protein